MKQVQFLRYGRSLAGMAALLGMAACPLSAWALPPWATPEVNSINRLPARAVAVPCESATKALMIARGDLARTESKWLQSLNGVWGFRWKHTVDAPNWEKEGQIAVPGCWQLQGDFDPPLYTNSTTARATRAWSRRSIIRATTTATQWGFTPACSPCRRTGRVAA